MISVSNVNSAALLILQRANSVTATEQEKSGSDNLAATANGVGDKIAVTKQPAPAQSKISESMFSVNNVNITKMKLDLIDRTGKALGVDQADYASRNEFADAMKRALGRLKLEGGQAAVMGLEKELGLDKLGVTIDDVIDSARDPESNDKLTKALEKQTGKDADKSDEDEKAVQQRAARPNQIGLYGVANL